ncbi:MAG: hypothetical protein MJ198_06085 [Bacteroidales bacterium]|nr:hypothetical protein [Bacteroidales bacterium]
MKKLFLIVILILPLVGFSQSSFELSGFGQVGTNIRSEISYTTGVHFEWIPKSRSLGLNYSLRFGRETNHDFLFQCPVGAVTGLLAMAALEYTDSDIPAIGLLLCFIPEGVSYNVPMSDEIIFTPYLNPLLIEFTKEHIYPIMEIGVRVKVPLGSWLYGAANFSVQSPYHFLNTKTCVGMSLGTNF